MLFDSSVISQNSTSAGAFHSQLIYLRQTGCFPVSSVCFPQSPALLSSSLCFLLKVQQLSPSYITDSFQHLSHSLSNDSSISRLLKYVCAPPPHQSYPPIKLPLFSLHLSLFFSPLCHSHRALHSPCYSCSLSPHLPLL